MLKEKHQEALTEFKGAWKLANNLPHTIQEEQEHRSLLARLAIWIGWQGTSLLEWVTCLGMGSERWRPWGKDQISDFFYRSECSIMLSGRDNRDGWAVLQKVRIAHLEPLSLHQALEASDGPAGWIKDDLSQWGHLQGGICPFCTMNKHWCSLPETKAHAYCLQQVILLFEHLEQPTA